MRTSLIDSRGIPGQNFHRRARQFRGPSALVLACFTGLFALTRADAVVLGPTPWAVLFNAAARICGGGVITLAFGARGGGGRPR